MEGPWPFEAEDDVEVADVDRPSSALPPMATGCWFELLCAKYQPAPMPPAMHWGGVLACYVPEKEMEGSTRTTARSMPITQTQRDRRFVPLCVFCSHVL